jgi:hypothetical protein
VGVLAASEPCLVRDGPGARQLLDPAIDAALEDLLARIRDYGTASDDLARSFAPGGHLHEQLRQIKQFVDQIAREQSQSQS